MRWLKVIREDLALGRAVRKAFDPVRETLRVNGATEIEAVASFIRVHRNLSSVEGRIKFLQFEYLAAQYGINTRRFEASRAPPTEAVNAFADHPDHPFFNDVAEDIIRFLLEGSTLEGAYERAVWGNPEVRRKELARRAAIHTQKVSDSEQRH